MVGENLRTMSDLARALGTSLEEQTTGTYCNMLKDCADEMERLENQLEMMANMVRKLVADSYEGEHLEDVHVYGPTLNGLYTLSVHFISKEVF